MTWKRFEIVEEYLSLSPSMMVNDARMGKSTILINAFNKKGTKLRLLWSQCTQSCVLHKIVYSPLWIHSAFRTYSKLRGLGIILHQDTFIKPSSQ